MAPQSIYMATRLREVLLNGKWIANTNFKEQLNSISFEQATQRVANCNTIAHLIFHINYYLNGMITVLEGGSLSISDKFSFDMPEIKTHADWEDLKQSFLHNGEHFAEQTGQLDDAFLNQPFVAEEYGTWLRNIEAMIEHSYYHLGQVVLLKKIMTTP